MTTPSVGVERRVGQRFPYLLSVSFREPATGVEGLGFTQDLSSRGAFFLSDAPLHEGAEIELTLKMPSEITLGESMPVRCRGQVLRITKPADNSWKPATSAETKIGVAVCLKDYEYLPETEDGPADFRRISALHGPSETERPAAPQPASPRATAH